MGITTFTQEFPCPIPPERMFKGFILDFHNLIPKLMPHAIHNIEIIEGGEGVGSIRKTTLVHGSHFKFMKHRIDALDKEKFTCKYSLIEGDLLGEHVEFIRYEVKFETSGHGGYVCKMTSEYHTKGDFEIKEEEIKGGKEESMAMYKVIEDYLLKNPEVYA